MADRRVTPRHGPLKFSRNTKTPTNMNATVCNTFRSSSSHKIKTGSGFKPSSDTASLNSTMAPRMKSTVTAAPFVDTELELDFAYNDYLQALMKQEIMYEKISDHKIQLNYQVCQQLEDIYNMEKKHSEMKYEVEKVEKLNEINELIIFTQKINKELGDLERQYNVTSSLDVLLSLLQKACNKIIFKKVKPIATQEDYDKLIELLKSCSVTVEKMLNSTNNFEEVKALAESITELNNLKGNLLEKQNMLANQGEAIIYKLLEDVSDSFATQNGY